MTLSEFVAELKDIEFRTENDSVYALSAAGLFLNGGLLLPGDRIVAIYFPVRRLSTKNEPLVELAKSLNKGYPFPGCTLFVQADVLSDSHETSGIRRLLRVGGLT